MRRKRIAGGKGPLRVRGDACRAVEAIGAGPGEQQRQGMISRLTISPAGAVNGCSYIDPGDLPDDVQRASCAWAYATRLEGIDGGGERVMTFVSG